MVESADAVDAEKRRRGALVGEEADDVTDAVCADPCGKGKIYEQGLGRRGRAGLHWTLV